MNPEVLTAKKWYRWLWLSPLLTIPTFVFCFVFFTQPVVDLICDRNSRNCDYYLIGSVIGILGSGLWHLILLVPALNKQSEFVRWHGRQALLLAGLRTAIPVAFLVYGYVLGGGYIALAWLWFIPVLILVWLFGTLWGQRQAARGDCALMRWTGHGAGLPLPTGTAKPTAAPGHGPLIYERPDHRAAYDRGLRLREQGNPDQAARVFYALLVSDATPELKARVAQSLNQISGIDEHMTPDVLVAIFRFSRDPEQQRMVLATLNLLGLVEAL